MNEFEMLASELMDSFDRSGPPPKDKVSEAIRGEMAVLRLLKREERSLSAGDISRMIAMRTSRIAAVLGSLEKKGLVTRSAHKEDRRVVMVSLTEKGSALCLQRREAAKKHLTKILEGLGNEDAAQYVRLMKRVHEVMRQVGPPTHEQEEGNDADE